MKCLKEPKTIVDHVRNICVDIEMGGAPLGGTVKTKYASEGAEDTSNSSYQILKELFSMIDINDEDVLIDLGCGKGRVLQYWLKAFPNHRIIGIELDPIIADYTRKRLRKYSNCTVITGSVLDKLPRDASDTSYVFFMFNPFDARVMKTLNEKLHKFPVKAIIYYNCACINIFDDDTTWSIKKISSKYTHHPCAIIKPKEG